MENDVVITSVPEAASFADLRAMLSDTPPAAAPVPEPAKPAEETAAKETPEAPKEAESAPTTESEKPVQERDEQGKFKAKDGLPEDIQKTVNKRIAKEIEKRRALEAQVEELRTKLAGQPGSQPAKEPAAPAANDPEPKSDDFQSYDEYADKHARWAARQEFHRLQSEQSEKQARETAETDARQKIAAYRTRRAEFEAEHPDYDEVIGGVSDPPPHLAAALLESENGPAVAYALAKDKAEYERIAKMQPTAALLALGRFEAKLTAPPAPPPKPSPLPKPPANVGGGGGPAAIDLATCDFRTFKREAARILKGD